jgi:hypothetical protein
MTMADDVRMPADGPLCAGFTARLSHDMRTVGWHFHKAHEGPFDRFQVLGERGCGTNVIRKTVQDALAIMRTEALGWKHGIPAMIALPPTFLTICAVRAPDTWARSLYNRPWHAPASLQALEFAAFLRAPWQACVDRISHFEGIHPELVPKGLELQWDRHPVTGARFENIFAMRNLKHRALLSLPLRGASVVYVSLDAFNAAPQAFVADLSAAFGLAATARGYAPVTRRMGNRFTPALEGRAAAPDLWEDADIAWMHSQLAPAQETALGFRPES